MLRLIFKDEEKTPVDDQIDAVLKRMSSEGVDSDEYPRLMTYLERLNKLKQQGKRQPVSLDTVFHVAGSFLSVFLIVAYEQKHVMSSRALTLIRPGTTKA